MASLEKIARGTKGTQREILRKTQRVFLHPLDFVRQALENISHKFIKKCFQKAGFRGAYVGSDEHEPSRSGYTHQQMPCEPTLPKR